MGTFYGVGVGPGDPELITRKAERVLRAVDVIYHPASARGSFVRRIVEPLVLGAEKFRAVSLCMARDRRRDEQAYAVAADAIVAELRQGKSAAWIAEGDPLFYSTFVHVYAEIRQRYPEVALEIVPGVSSMQSASARVGWPVARLDENVAVVPAAYGIDRLPELLDTFVTVFLLKVHAVIDRLLDRLAEMPAEAIYLEKIGTPEERVVTDLRSLRGQELSYFSLVILRRVPGASAKRR